MFGRAPPYARERRVFKGRGGSRWPSLAFLFLFCLVSFCFEASPVLGTIQPESSGGTLPIRGTRLGVGGSWLTSLHRVYGWGGDSSWVPSADVKLAPVEWLQEGRGIPSSQPF